MKQYWLPIIAIIVAVVALVVALRPISPVVGPFGSAVSATFSETQASTTQTVLNTSSSQQILTGNARRAYWEICNYGTIPVYLSFNTPAVTSSGMLVNPAGSSTEVCKREVYPTIDNGNIYAIENSSVSTTLGISSGLAL